MPLIGRPTLIGSVKLSFFNAHQIGASVGPYIFHSSETLGSKYSTSASVNLSPPDKATRLGDPSQLIFFNIFHIEGVACIKVIGYCCKIFAIHKGSRCSFWLVKKTVLP